MKKSKVKNWGRWSGVLCLLLAVALAFGGVPAGYSQTPAPETTPAGPTSHIIQEGETLVAIAEQYGTTVEAIQLLNNIADPALIYAGQSLIIPSETGDNIPTTYTVQVGDSLAGIAAAFGSSPAEIGTANRLINPHSLYAGQTLSLISHNGTLQARPVTGTLHLVENGDSLLLIAARYAVTPAAILEANQLTSPYLFAGMRLQIPGHGENYQFLTGEWRKITVGPSPFGQGQTVSVYVENSLAGQPAGQFAGQTLHFTPYQSGYVALVGLGAGLTPGRYALQLGGSGDQPWTPFEQPLEIRSGNFPTQTVYVADELIPLLAPEVRAEEDAFLATIYGQVSDQQLWEGLFQIPVSTTLVTADYGILRSYNGGPFDIFHTGIDLAGTNGTPIVAVANGVVVFSDFVQLRGNVVILDHGWGVMSGYYHLSRGLVSLGAVVPAGTVIGEGGSTGLSTGPHLHWDLRINNVPVDGRQWTQHLFP